MRKIVKPTPNKSRTGEAAKAAKTVKAGQATANSKADVIVTLLARPRGASVLELTKATGWQPHSIRGFLSGELKKKRQLNMHSERIDGVQRHRLLKGR